ncbi:insulin-like growth factor-binding protein-related protein 1 [Fopius arisanus]|uniref:Insulin-like growth factor-binding protein-related protein 1 n=1 Tax=Fopius arisanus TaxID=64838 RepID=A0A9R1TWH9_9HYME|nr:PREDICTED: insulin-like growth factor-binding protein-related protein 1 [Fopius arisanus]
MTYSTPFIIAFLSLSLWFCIEICADDTISNVMGLKDCGVCELYRCPDNSSRCLLGSVPDPCECCPGGRCARLEGETCWNASISSLSVTKRERGLCATNYLCQLRNDLLDEGLCPDNSSRCLLGSVPDPCECCPGGRCARLEGETCWNASISSLSVTKRERGLCATNYLCQLRNDLLDEIHLKYVILDEEHGGTVHTTDGPENLMKTSWMQVSSVMRQHSGTYQCIANNTLGHASSAAFLSVMI